MRVPSRFALVCRRTALLLALAIVPVVASSAPAGARTVFVFEHNIFGMRSGAGYNTNAASTTLAYVGALPSQPYSLALSEVCTNQYGPLAYVYGFSGYSANYFASEWRLDDPQNCAWLGNAIYYKGAYQSNIGVQFSSANQDPAETNIGSPLLNGRHRGFVCGQSSFYYFSLVSCSTHLAIPENYYAPPQFAEMSAFVGYIYSGNARMMAGDLNQSTSQIYLSAVNGYYESNFVYGCYITCFVATRDNGSQLDYIFSTFVDAPFASTSNDTASDHKFYVGYIP